MSDKNPIDPNLVKEFVLASHASLEKVEALLNKEPGLVRASMDWREGDWECGLEAAGHIGNRDLARFLLANGAPMTIFCAAMLGETDLVGAFLDSDPETAHRPGVHGISLMYHVALSGKVEIADLLLPHAPPGCDGAIHGAIRFGHTNMVVRLIEHGVDDVTSSTSRVRLLWQQRSRRNRRRSPICSEVRADTNESGAPCPIFTASGCRCRPTRSGAYGYAH